MEMSIHVLIIEHLFLLPTPALQRLISRFDTCANRSSALFFAKVYHRYEGRIALPSPSIDLLWRLLIDLSRSFGDMNDLNLHC